MPAPASFWWTMRRGCWSWLELNTINLKSLGYRVLAFSDPLHVMRAFLLADPRRALVATDYAMETMNGMEVISTCRPAESPPEGHLGQRHR